MAISKPIGDFWTINYRAASFSTPSIGFKNIGVQEVIKHKETGYLADYNNTEDLFNGSKMVL